MLWEIKGLFYILKYDKNTFSTIFWNSSLEILDITPTLKVFLVQTGAKFFLNSIFRTHHKFGNMNFCAKNERTKERF